MKPVCSVESRAVLKLAMASGSSAVDPATKEVLRYREALWQGFHRIRKVARMSLRLSLILYVQALLTRAASGTSPTR